MKAFMILHADLKDKGEEWRDVKVYGQEITSVTASIARMNLYLHGIHDFSIVNDDTLEHPAFIINGKVQQFDVVLANPPYSIKQWNREKFEHDKFGRCFLGVPPQDCADYAFIQHILTSLNEKTGRCAILLPLGLLSKNSETVMRTNLIKSNLLEAIIGLGPNLFYNSPMEAMIMVCNKNKTPEMQEKVLFINAVQEVTRKNADSYLEKKHIQKISQAFNEKKDIDYFCRIVDNKTLLENGSNMTISLYVMPKIEREMVLPFVESIAGWSKASQETNEGISTLINML